MLRDSRSYEVQIIDAVRSVNKALGGTYGTSSAIYKNEFNQFEVQLVDAIRGIGRTLSGHGFSLAGGGGEGASNEALLALSKRVSKLESESFFRLVDGNVTLKTEYQNLWVPGWLAAGEIGNGSGGGVTVVDNLTSSSTTDALSANQGRTIKSIIDAGYVFKGFLHPEDSGTAVCDYPVCYLTGISGAYYGYGPLNVNLNDGELALIYRAKNSSTWDYTTTTISGSGGGGGGSYSAGTGINISNNVISLKTASTSQLGGVKVDGTTITISNGVISSSGGGGGSYTEGTGIDITNSVISLKTASSSAIGGIRIGYQESGKNYAVALDENNKAYVYVPWEGGGGGSGISLADVWSSLTASTGTYGSTKINASHIPDLSGTYVTVAGDPQTVTSAKTFTAQMTAANIVPGGTNTLGASGSRWNKVWAVDEDLSGNLSMASSSHIDIGPLRIKYENNALHVTKASSSDQTNYGFYADGPVSAGGIGSDTGFVKYVNLANQSAYDNLSSYDNSTIYTIGSSTITKVYLGRVVIYS